MKQVVIIIGIIIIACIIWAIIGLIFNFPGTFFLILAALIIASILYKMRERKRTAELERYRKANRGKAYARSYDELKDEKLIEYQAYRDSMKGKANILSFEEFKQDQKILIEYKRYCESRKGKDTKPYEEYKQLFIDMIQKEREEAAVNGLFKVSHFRS